MLTKEDVASLASAVGELKLDPAVEIETSGLFGLSAYLYDPISGQIITLAQPQRIDVGQSEILLTPLQAAAAVVAARAAHAHNIRAAGFVSTQDYSEAQKRAAASRELANKQAIERAKIDEAHAEARSAIAAEAAPKKTELVVDPEPMSPAGEPVHHVEAPGGETPRQKLPQPL